MEIVIKKAVNSNTGQEYEVKLPVPKVVRQAILKLNYPDDGIRVVDATETLAETFQLSGDQKGAKNRSNLNVFRYDIVAPQFKRLLDEGKLKQPGARGPDTFLLKVWRPLPLWGWWREPRSTPTRGKNTK